MAIVGVNARAEKLLPATCQVAADRRTGLEISGELGLFGLHVVLHLSLKEQIEN
jgi:hypothetical protein